MTYQEDYLNVRIADHIRRMTADLGWNVREEAKGVLRDDKLKSPI